MNWIEQSFDLAWQGTQLTWDAQQVIAMRLSAFARGGPSSGPEASRMVAEKVDAVFEAQRIAMQAVGRGEFDGGAAEIMRHYRTEVRANQRRLGRA